VRAGRSPLFAVARCVVPPGGGAVAVFLFLIRVAVFFGGGVVACFGLTRFMRGYCRLSFGPCCGFFWGPGCRQYGFGTSGGFRSGPGRRRLLLAHLVGVHDVRRCCLARFVGFREVGWVCVCVCVRPHCAVVGVSSVCVCVCVCCVCIVACL